MSGPPSAKATPPTMAGFHALVAAANAAGQATEGSSGNKRKRGGQAVCLIHSLAFIKIYNLSTLYQYGSISDISERFKRVYRQRVD